MYTVRWRSPAVVAAIILLKIVTAALGAGLLASCSEADDKGRARHLTRIAGRFIDARTDQGVVPTELQYRLRLEGERRWSESRPLAVSEDGSFALPHIPVGAVAVELEAELPDRYMRLPPVMVRYEGSEPKAASSSLSGPVLQPGLNLRVPVTSGGVIRGRVHVTGGSLPKRASVLAFWDPHSPFDPGMELASPIDESGAFRMARLPRGRVVRVAVGGLGQSGLLSQQVQARGGGSALRIDVNPGLAIRGLVISPERGCVVHAIRRPSGSGVGLGALGHHGAEVGADGRFLVQGLAPGSYDVVVAREGETACAVLRDVRPGTQDLTVKLPKRVQLRGRVTGLPVGTEASVEVWWAARGVPLADMDTVDGRFSFHLPVGVRYSVFARYEDKVALVEDVAPPAESLVLKLVPGLTLSAKVPDSRGPLFALAGRRGLRFSAWVNAGEAVRFEPVPPGEYQVQLLGYAQAQSYLLALNRMLVPQEESWARSATVQAGVPGQRLKSP